MDTKRIFAKECMDYMPSGEVQTSFLARFFITMKFSLRFFTYLTGNFLVYMFWRMFKWRSPKDISDNVALVTGGGNGLGKAIALRLAKEKCHVAIVDLDIVAAEKTVAEIQAIGVKAKAYKMDVSDYDQLVALRSQIAKDIGCVSILINNAALIALVPMCETPKDQIQRIIDVNICSQIWTTKIFLEGMVEQQKGHIVQICSIYGLVHGKSTMYSMTKHAIHAFTSCLEEEIHWKNWQNNIKLTRVYPFFIATRKEITDIVRKDQMIVNSPEYAADKILHAIKYEEHCISIPKGYYMLTRIFTLFPARSIRSFYSATFGKKNNIF